MEVSEKDWKLFSSRIAGWQEAYMDKLNKTYTDILASENTASEKFHKLRDKINEDFNSPGVLVERKRSKLLENMVSLIRNGVITFDDLSDFSEELKESVKMMAK